MTFKLVKDALANLIGSIERTAVTSVNALKAHTFDAEIKNFPKTQDVKGTVVVGNQKNVEKEIKTVNKSIKAIKTQIAKIKAPKSIEVSNFPETPKFPEIKIPDSVEVSNFPKQKFPEEFKVSNHPVRELKKLETELKKLGKAVKKLKLDPKIEVKAPKPERVMVPPAEVNVEKTEVDYKKLANIIATKTPKVDYEKLAEALASEMAQMVITSGGGGSKYAFKDEQGRGSYARVDSSGAIKTQSSDYITHDIDEGATTTYTGAITSDGAWRITRIVNDSELRYALGESDYATNWTDRENLTYSYIGG